LFWNGHHSPETQEFDSTKVVANLPSTVELTKLNRYVLQIAAWMIC
jgi:hypothetical protein